MSQIDKPPSAPERRARVILFGAGLGALIGLLSSYLYTRAAEENAADGGAPRPIPTGQLLAVLLAVLGLIRQIAELGKPKKPKKK